MKSNKKYKIITIILLVYLLALFVSIALQLLQVVDTILLVGIIMAMLYCFVSSVSINRDKEEE